MLSWNLSVGQWRSARCGRGDLKAWEKFGDGEQGTLATEGASLARLAETVKAQLSFEAAVGGASPLLKRCVKFWRAIGSTSVRGI